MQGEASTRWGCSMGVEEFGATGLAELATLAESLGYTDLWGIEAWGYDGVATSSALVRATRTARVGTAVLNVFSRTPFTLAMTAASLDDLSGGRFCLGIGSSSKKIIEDWHGLPFDRPFTRTKESLAAIRGLLAGERVDMEGETVRLRGAKLGLPPARPVPIWLGALGPKMLRLAGEAADGVILTLTGPGPAGEMAATAKEAARARGAERFEVLHRTIMPYPGDDPQALATVRQLVADYCLVPVYRSMFERFGFAASVARVDEARASGGRARAREAVSDELLAEFTVVGTAEEQYQRLREFQRNGVDVPLLGIYGGSPDLVERRAAVEEAMRWFAQRRQRDLDARPSAPGAA